MLRNPLKTTLKHSEIHRNLMKLLKSTTPTDETQKSSREDVYLVDFFGVFSSVLPPVASFGPSLKSLTDTHTAATARICLSRRLLDLYMLLIVSHTRRLVMPPRQSVSVSERQSKMYGVIQQPNQTKTKIPTRHRCMEAW